MSSLDAFLDCAAFMLSCVDCMKTTDDPNDSNDPNDYKKFDTF